MDALSLLPVASLIDAFWLSNLAGQIIVVVLFAGSIVVWAVMATKWMELREAQRASARFLRMYRNEGTPVAIFLKGIRFAPSPLYAIYENACKALGAIVAPGHGNDLFVGESPATRVRLTELQVNSVRNVAESTMAEQALKLESRMNVIAIGVSAAPLLGLLGTVWGVLDAFAVMSRAGSAMLSAVAPGVSGALLTTVIGLLVALPSAIGYNLLAERIRRQCIETDTFLEELMTDIATHYQIR
ncbi:MAG: MotA/TolQ/ExbB proton channel family protein [Kiritimatiellae bacterium]|nr:MotA/TolQ/ExbB proton channel family protein [Kiritimatiellia bacterium]